MDLAMRPSMCGLNQLVDDNLIIVRIYSNPKVWS